MSRLAILAALLVLPALSAPSATACSAAEGYRIPSNFELVRRAELIVLARVVSGSATIEGRDPRVLLEPVRVLKGALPAEPLSVSGALTFGDRPMESMPTPLGPSHFSAGLGACVRLFYPQGGLVVALFERTPEGLQTIWAAWGRTVEDVEAPDGSGYARSRPMSRPSKAWPTAACVPPRKRGWRCCGPRPAISPPRRSRTTSSIISTPPRPAAGSGAATPSGTGWTRPAAWRRCCSEPRRTRRWACAARTAGRRSASTPSAARARRSSPSSSASAASRPKARRGPR